MRKFLFLLGVVIIALAITLMYGSHRILSSTSSESFQQELKNTIAQVLSRTDRPVEVRWSSLESGFPYHLEMKDLTVVSESEILLGFDRVYLDLGFVDSIQLTICSNLLSRCTLDLHMDASGATGDIQGLVSGVLVDGKQVQLRLLSGKFDNVTVVDASKLAGFVMKVPLTAKIFTVLSGSLDGKMTMDMKEGEIPHGQIILNGRELGIKGLAALVPELNVDLMSISLEHSESGYKFLKGTQLEATNLKMFFEGGFSLLPESKGLDWDLDVAIEANSVIGSAALAIIGCPFQPVSWKDLASPVESKKYRISGGLSDIKCEPIDP